MRPSEKQQEHIDRIVGEPSQAALVNLATGAGKTLVAMSVAKALAPDQVLIIAPLNTRGGWKVHAERVWPGRPFLSIESRNSNFEKLALGHSGIYFVTKDYFAKRSWTQAEVSKVMAWMTDNQANGADGARWFIQNIPEVWTKWVPADVADKVKAAVK